MSALLFLTLAATVQAQPRAISDIELARIDHAPFDRSAKMSTREVLGVNRGMIVAADYPCSDICPDYTVRIIHYDRPAGPGCEAAGGVSVTRTVPRSIAAVRERFCVPAVTANAR